MAESIRDGFIRNCPNHRRGQCTVPNACWLVQPCRQGLSAGCPRPVQHPFGKKRQTNNNNFQVLARLVASALSSGQLSLQRLERNSMRTSGANSPNDLVMSVPNGKKSTPHDRTCSLRSSGINQHSKNPWQGSEPTSSQGSGPSKANLMMED